MLPAETVKLFHLKTDKTRYTTEEAVQLRRLIYASYPTVDYAEAKKILLEIICKWGNQRSRLWYMEKVYDQIKNPKDNFGNRISGSEKTM